MRHLAPCPYGPLDPPDSHTYCIATNKWHLSLPTHEQDIRVYITDQHRGSLCTHLPPSANIGKIIKLDANYDYEGAQKMRIFTKHIQRMWFWI